MGVNHKDGHRYLQSTLVIFFMHAAFVPHTCDTADDRAFSLVHPLTVWHWFPVGVSTQTLQLTFPSGSAKGLIVVAGAGRSIFLNLANDEPSSHSEGKLKARMSSRDLPCRTTLPA